uniref:Cadherin domain-containing protein n=1 Tax=Romanomermis culicivorax TaxID=13658 RepID=A0A915JJZ2_ROMCU
MTTLQWILHSGIITFLWITPNIAETLNLKIDPLFELVPENWTVDSALPNLSICPIYNGWKNLTLSIISGDPQGYFRLKQTNATCSTLVLAKELDADIINADGSRGQSFNLAIKCTDGWLMVYGNFDVQVVDVNDNAPKFVKTDNAYMVSEDTEIGSHLFTITTFDPDTGVGGIDSFILEVNEIGYMELGWNSTAIIATAIIEVLQKANGDKAPPEPQHFDGSRILMPVRKKLRMRVRLVAQQMTKTSLLSKL